MSYKVHINAGTCLINIIHLFIIIRNQMYLDLILWIIFRLIITVIYLMCYYSLHDISEIF